MERYILEVQKLDSMRRVKHSTIAGVFRSLKAVEAYKQHADPGLVFSIKCWTDPAHRWSVNH